MRSLGIGQKPEVMNKYPHMMPLDAIVWTRYLRKPVTPITKVWYDVHVGGGIPGAQNRDDMMRRISQGVGRKRIDVVAEVFGGFWIIEVKPFASMMAVGQVLCYTRLFNQEFGVNGQISSVIICENADMDLLDSYVDFNVGVITV